MTNARQIHTLIRAIIIMIAAMPLAAVRIIAQSYSHLPTASTTDDRFLSIAGGNIQTLGDNPLIFKLASPAGASSFEIGIFDGDTYGIFDQGTTPLIYTLYADPDGDGSGSVQIAEWRGDAMLNDAWYTATVGNVAAARCGCGDYFYILKVRSSDPATFHWSSFKLRTDGTIVMKRASNFAFSAPLGSAFDASVVYPAYPTLTPTTYDGTWHFYMDVPNSISSLALWDGDFDRGSYDCSDNDTDDNDTPNTLPGWATGAAVAEGRAASSIGCQDGAGQPIGGNTTSNPPDDSRSPTFARAGRVSYEIIAPDGARYANDNPSGNLEWEQFRISTDPFNRNTMDYHAAALPAGSYDIAISGQDLANLDAMRFPFDVAGVDADGNAVAPIRPDYSDGSISGTVYYEGGGNCSQGLLEPGIPLATVNLSTDYDNDGVADATWSTTTDVLGHFSFTGLHPGTYTVTVDAARIVPAVTAVCDSDGASTPDIVKATLTMCNRSMNCLFGYKNSGHLL